MWDSPTLSARYTEGAVLRVSLPPTESTRRRARKDVHDPFSTIVYRKHRNSSVALSLAALASVVAILFLVSRCAAVSTKWLPNRLGRRLVVDQETQESSQGSHVLQDLCGGGDPQLATAAPRHRSSTESLDADLLEAWGEAEGEPPQKKRKGNLGGQLQTQSSHSHAVEGIGKSGETADTADVLRHSILLYVEQTLSENHEGLDEEEWLRDPFGEMQFLDEEQPTQSFPSVESAAPGQQSFPTVGWATAGPQTFSTVEASAVGSQSFSTVEASAVGSQSFPTVASALTGPQSFDAGESAAVGQQSFPTVASPAPGQQSVPTVGCATARLQTFSTVEASAVGSQSFPTVASALTGPQSFDAGESAAVGQQSFPTVASPATGPQSVPTVGCATARLQTFSTIDATGLGWQSFPTIASALMGSQSFDAGESAAVGQQSFPTVAPPAPGPQSLPTVESAAPAPLNGSPTLGRTVSTLLFLEDGAADIPPNGQDKLQGAIIMQPREHSVAMQGASKTLLCQFIVGEEGTKGSYMLLGSEVSDFQGGPALAIVSVPLGPSDSQQSSRPVDIGQHPFYRIPSAEPGACVREFQNIQLPSFSRKMYCDARTLLRVNQYLKKPLLSARDLDSLMFHLERLVFHAVRRAKENIDGIQPKLIVERLAFALLVTDAMYAASEVLGTPAKRSEWWPKIIATLPVYSGPNASDPPRATARQNVLLAQFLHSVLEFYKSGSRPPAAALVPLKQILLCTPAVPALRRGPWVHFMADDLEWQKSQ